jgi:hypothetical protein
MTAYSPLKEILLVRCAFQREIFILRQLNYVDLSCKLDNPKILSKDIKNWVESAQAGEKFRLNYDIVII